MKTVNVVKVNDTDTVYSYYENGKLVYKEVREYYYNGSIKTIRTSNGEVLKFTEDGALIEEV